MRTAFLAVILAMALAAPARAEESREPSYQRSDVLKWTMFGLGMAHLADHALRNNHSGIPFSSKLTPATAAYFGVPAIFALGLKYDGPLYWLIADSVLLVGVGLTHLFVETPGHVHEPWTNGSNLLEAESKTAGVTAVVIVGGVSAAIGAHLISTIIDGRAHGFTWKRRKESHRAPVTFVPVTGGGMVSAGWRF